MVSSRGLEVLRAIVQDYVSSREPVGSKAIVDRHSFGVSAATIRNDMALLEEEDLIVAPHTSSGRVPTDKGYRTFVDNLTDIKQVSPAQRHAIERFLSESADFDELLSRTVRLLSQLTNQVALVQYPSLGITRIRRVEVVSLGARRALCVVITDNGRVEQRLLDFESAVTADELDQIAHAVNRCVGNALLTEVIVALKQLPTSLPASLALPAERLSAAITDAVQANRQQRLVMAGTANLVRTGDDFAGSLYPVLDAIEEQVILLRLFTELASDSAEVSVSIGRENTDSALEQTSLITSGYAAAGELSTVGLLGPTRMDYSSNIAAVRAVARYLTRLLDAN
jgi:heat-inducible transcriptional repressor